MTESISVVSKVKALCAKLEEAICLCKECAEQDPNAASHHLEVARLLNVHKDNLATVISDTPEQPKP